MDKKKILIIDDDKVFIKVFLDTVAQKGTYIIVTASDGKEGLEAALKEKPDVILTDLRMPNMDGVEFIRKLREHSDFINTPIFIISQFSEPEKIAEGTLLGIKGYIVKADMSVEEIIEKIEKFL